MSENPTLSERIRANQINNERATAERDQRKQEEIKRQEQQAQAELDQYNKEVEQYNIDLANYNAQQKDIENQQPQDDFTKQYNELINARTLALQNVPKTQTIARKGADIVRPASRKQIAIYQNQIYNDFQSKIDALTKTQTQKNQQKEFQTKYPNAVLGRSALNEIKNSQGKISYVQAYEKQQATFEARRERNSLTSIAKAKANAITARVKTETITQELNQAKKPEPVFIFSKEPTKAGDLKPKSEKPQRILTQPAQELPQPPAKNQEIYNQQQQLKEELRQKTISNRPQSPTQPQKTYSDKSTAFLTQPPPKVGSIIGTTDQRSAQAVYTFEQTQAQQKELSRKFFQAKNSQEAIKIKEEFQKINPYVGTPQTANTKGGIVAKQGTLIEKRLESSKEEFETSLQPPKETTTTTETTKEIVTTSSLEYWGIKDSSGKPFTDKSGNVLKFTSEKSAQRYKENLLKSGSKTETSQTSKYTFTDAVTGEPLDKNTALLWKAYNQEFVKPLKAIQPPSKSDIEFNQSLRELLKKDPNLIIYKDEQTTVIDPVKSFPLIEGLKDFSTELINVGEDVIHEVNPDYKQKFPRKISLETLAYNEFAEKFKPDDYAKYTSQTPTVKEFVQEKLKTPEGQEYLAGTILATGGTYGATIIKNPIKGTIQYFKKEKPLETVKNIADQIFKPTIQDDYRTARLKELNPDLSNQEINKLKDILYPKQTQKEIELTNKLKEFSPDLPQERINYIISQANKADAIKKYEQQRQLKEALKGRFPGMNEKTLNQKVATMTAQESEDIPYYVEKLDDKTYLISAGRESKASETPFIVVNFKKSRFGKEIGTYDLYEPTRTTLNPKEILISGISKKELEKGQVIAKSKASTVTRYPPTRYNLERATSENSKLEQIGTVKTGKLADLKKYPKENIESMVQDSRKTAILETKHELDALKKAEQQAKRQYELGIKTTKTEKPKPTINKITEKPTLTKEQKQTMKDFTTPPTKEQTQTVKDFTNIIIPEKTDRLKDIARNIAQNPTQENYSNLKSFSASALSNIAIQGTAQSIRSAQGTRQEIKQTSKEIQIGQQRELTVTIPDKSEITKQREFLTERNLIKEKLQEKQKQIVTAKYSLINIPGLGEKLDQGIKLDIITDITQVTKQKELQLFKFPTPPDEPPGRSRFGLPGAILPDSKKEKEIKALEGLKPKTVYFSWNVNLLEPGRYLPTADLVVGTKPSILKRTDKIQRQVTKGSYRYKLDKQVTSRLDKAITKPDDTYKDKSRKESFKSKTNKSSLRNLDRSLAKEPRSITKKPGKFNFKIRF